MSAFDDMNAAAAIFNEAVMGGVFTHTPAAGGSTTSGLLGVFAQPQAAFDLGDFSQKQTVALTVVTSKAQWAAVVPGNGDVIVYGSTSYSVDSVDGLDDVGEPCFTLGLKVLT